MTTETPTRRKRTPPGYVPRVFDPDDAATLSRVADLLDPQPNPWAADPNGWVQAKCGEETWSKQTEILESVRDNRTTVVRSAHGTGKSHIAARAAAWWVDSHPLDDVFIVTTAPSTNQVKGILWRYLKQVKTKAGLAGNITDSDVPEWKIDGRLVGWGRKPADLNDPEKAATMFQGIHAKYVLVILDEACGIPNWLWVAVKTLLTSPTNRCLAIGNPDDPKTQFEKVCRPGSGWHKIKISAFDTPAYTGEKVSQDLLDALVSKEWVDEAARDWGVDSSLYTAKVKAEFPEESDDVLIPPSLICKAMQRDLSGDAAFDKGVYALDVARKGADENVLARNRAGRIRVIDTWRGLDLMQTAGKVVKLLGWQGHKFEVGGIVDANGIGAGVYDRCKEQGMPVRAFNSSNQAHDPRRFYNRRAEVYWMMREGIDNGLIDLPDENDPDADDALIAQLGSIKYTTDSAGRIKMEKKEDHAKRVGSSPDRADAAVMTLLPRPPAGKQLNPGADTEYVPEDERSLTDGLMEKAL